MNNKENKVGIHFISLGDGGPPNHTRPGHVVFRSRDIPKETGSSASPVNAPLSGTDEGTPPLGACSTDVCCS